MNKEIKYGFKNEREESFPSMIIMDITKVCNAECIHCPHSKVKNDPRFKNGPIYMSWEVFTKITDQVAQFPDTNFRFSCHGEPLLHPDFIKMIKYTKNKGLKLVSVNTNGSLLKKDLSEKILDLGIDLIEVSLDAFNKETYNSIRRKLNYDTVISNLHNLVDLRNKKNSPTKIFVSIIDQPEVKDELKEFTTYWENLVDKVITRIYFSINNLVDSSKVTFKPNYDRYPCPFLWKRITVNIEGYIKYCLEDWFDEKIIEYDLNEPIHKIWTSEKYNKIRKLHLEGKFNELEFCGKCEDWWVHWWEGDYFSALRNYFK